MEVLGAFAKLSTEGSVTRELDLRAEYRRGRTTRLPQFFRGRECNDQMKRRGDTHHLRLNDEHRVIVVHQRKSDLSLVGMSVSVQVMGSGEGIGWTRKRSPQREEIQRSNVGIPLLDLNHLKTYPMMLKNNSVDFSRWLLLLHI